MLLSYKKLFNIEGKKPQFHSVSCLTIQLQPEFDAFVKRPEKLKKKRYSKGIINRLLKFCKVF